ncbi:MAG TPA: hypothetical protein VGS19_01665, partial [Streptosporangiaceae bacterium]|nr:hypothetical protein [Streptosporangiaceae bacterium]
MSIRLRLAVVFAVASAVLFAAGSWVFVTELSSALLRSIDAQLSARLEGAGRYLPAGDPPPDEGSSADSATRPASATAARAPSPSPAGAGTPAPTLSPSFAGTPAPGEYVVQVVDPSGHVRGGSADAGQAPLLGPAELRRARTHSIVLFGNDEGERERVMAGPLRPDLEHPGWVAVVAVSLESFDA